MNQGMLAGKAGRYYKLLPYADEGCLITHLGMVTVMRKLISRGENSSFSSREIYSVTRE